MLLRRPSPFQLVSRVAWLLVALLTCLVLGPTRSALANGGTIQVASRPSGPYSITVSTSPSPLTVGVADVSVMVQRAGSDEIVQDARVIVTAAPADGSGPSRQFEATRERATNKLFYAADVELPTAGRWRLGVDVTGREGAGAVSFEVEASQPGPLDAPLLLLLAIPPAALLVWWLLRSAGKKPARR